MVRHDELKHFAIAVTIAFGIVVVIIAAVILGATAVMFVFMGLAK